MIAVLTEGLGLIDHDSDTMQSWLKGTLRSSSSLCCVCCCGQPETAGFRILAKLAKDIELNAVGRQF